MHPELARLERVQRQDVVYDDHHVAGAPAEDLQQLALLVVQGRVSEESRGAGDGVQRGPAEWRREWRREERRGGGREGRSQE